MIQVIVVKTRVSLPSPFFLIFKLGESFERSNHCCHSVESTTKEKKVKAGKKKNIDKAIHFKKKEKKEKA